MFVLYLLFLREDPRDVKTLAQLIKAYSRVNLKKAEQYPFLILLRLSNLNLSPFISAGNRLRSIKQVKFLSNNVVFF